jgi:RNA recognition motif-containing protein
LKLDFKKSYDKDKPSFAFLTYEDPQNAQEAIDALNGRDFMGSILAVSQATANREKLEKNRIPRKNRFVANNLAPETSWQDLKGVFYIAFYILFYIFTYITIFHHLITHILLYFIDWGREGIFYYFYYYSRISDYNNFKKRIF